MIVTALCAPSLASSNSNYLNTCQRCWVSRRTSTLPIAADTMRKLKCLTGVLIGTVVLSFCSLSVLYAGTNSEFVLNAIGGEKLAITEGIKLIVGCIDKPFELEKFQEGSYWVLKNYIRADHGEIGCGDSITYTTHGDLTFLDNLPELIKRWEAPVSFALYAPGDDFYTTLEAIQYIRSCLPESDLIQYYVTFHIYFANDHMPQFIPKTEIEALNWAYNCLLPPPYANVNKSSMYRYSHDLLYPINVGRNIARKAAITHFILASDIELYPSLGLVSQFFEMVIRNTTVLYGTRPRVYPLVVFEIDEHSIIPRTKTELQLLLRNKTAIPFHQKVCKNCHAVPNLNEWMSANITDQLDVFTVGQRTLKYKYWEPFYVSDNQEPFFDERVTWEGQKNKRIQGFAMCLLDYEFHVLNNAFLIHSPGIKVFKRDPIREKHVQSMNALIKNEIVPEYKILFGRRSGCYP